MKELMQIQKNLKVKKGNLNKFGGYYYRSTEDILEAVKPLLAEYGCILTLRDEVVNIGERYYVKSTAKIAQANPEDGSTSYRETTAYAREQDTKKGMDEAQITGSASSYARKYALCGLFAIDDGEDADSHKDATQGHVQSKPNAVGRMSAALDECQTLEKLDAIEKRWLEVAEREDLDHGLKLISDRREQLK